MAKTKSPHPTYTPSNPNKEPVFETPMMLQYLKIKDQYSDCILFFRLGDFYEMFMDDAKIGSEVLDITLTARDRGKDGKIPMSGIPYHAVDSYLPRLVKAGYKVAICEQIGGVTVPGLVERDVVRVVTPGTMLDEHSLNGKENNYVMSLSFSDDTVGVALIDVSTGEFLFEEHPKKFLSETIGNEIAKYKPAECLLDESSYNNGDILRLLKKFNGLNIFPYTNPHKTLKDQENFLKKHFKVNSLIAFGLNDFPTAIQACSSVLSYVYWTQKTLPLHINKLYRQPAHDYMLLDRSTIMNLELFVTLRDGKRSGSLLGYLDKTATYMGGRLLKKWLAAPLIKVEEINNRQNAVEELMNNLALRTEILTHLKFIPDLERLLARLSAGLCNPRDLINLKRALEQARIIKDYASNFIDKTLYNLCLKIEDEALEISSYIDSVIVAEPPLDPKNGGFIRAEVSSELDELKLGVSFSKEYILQLEQGERQRTGINSLKVKFNKIFGYYIEITKSNVFNVPSDYIRKQTLVNCERYITPEMKHHEELILSADEKICALEYTLFLEIVKNITDHLKSLQNLCDSLAMLDCLICFSELALEKNLTRPHITTGGDLKLFNSRHPVVESFLQFGEFVPNDVLLSQTASQMLLITGPNMAGKSVFIRQVAIIVLMAHIGCFVPADEAFIPVIDRVFVRSGASDVISEGLSTFMVEMVETAYILNNLTAKSLVVMDEIGRGTSTYDGISIAWAIAEHLVSNSTFKPFVLFATHYHELQQLEEKFPNQIKNFSAQVQEGSEDLIFLHKISQGAAQHSFGIDVAKMAGVPKEVYSRARTLLKDFEKSKDAFTPSVLTDGSVLAVNKNLPEKLILLLSSLDLGRTTPIEALNILAEAKRILDS